MPTSTPFIPSQSAYIDKPNTHHLIPPHIITHLATRTSTHTSSIQQPKTICEKLQPFTKKRLSHCDLIRRPQARTPKPKQPECPSVNHSVATQSQSYDVLTRGRSDPVATHGESYTVANGGTDLIRGDIMAWLLRDMQRMTFSEWIHTVATLPRSTPWLRSRMAWLVPDSRTPWLRRSL